MNFVKTDSACKSYENTKKLYINKDRTDRRQNTRFPKKKKTLFVSTNQMKPILKLFNFNIFLKRKEIFKYITLGGLTRYR